MHVLFVHKNYPAQFGHIARHLVKDHGFRCTFISERPAGVDAGVRRLKYKIRGGATPRTHFCSRSVENFTWHSHAVFETLKAHPEVKPDLVVGHSGFGSTLFLADLYDCPIINYFEWYYRPRGAEVDFRGELPTHELASSRSRVRNAALLVDLQTCAAGYCPTAWQRSQLPTEYQHKLETIFDGIDTSLWHPEETRRSGPCRIGDREIPAGTKIVTYVARGFESMRGFDVFMNVAKRICDRRDDVVFVCVGSDRICYGGDAEFTKGKSFREYVLSQDDYDLDRFIFRGTVPASKLAEILRAGDLHIYLTVPFVLSWSLMNALACGCTVLASDTQPVREMVDHGRNGLLAPFYDVDGFVAQAMEVLDDPESYRVLGAAAAEMIDDRYSLTRVMPKMLELYQRVVSPPAAAAEGVPRRDVSESETAVPPADGLERLASQHGWPPEKPSVAGCGDFGWMRPAHRQMLAKVIPHDARVVVEVGAWRGLSTRLLAEHAPHATIVAVDHWKPNSRQDEGKAWKAMLPETYARFLVNCWPYRDRVIPLSMTSDRALTTLADYGIKPDVVYLQCSDAQTVNRDLALAGDLFGDAVLVGDNWQWPQVQRAIKSVVEAQFVEFEVRGNLWSIWRDGLAPSHPDSDELLPAAKSW